MTAAHRCTSTHSHRQRHKRVPLHAPFELWLARNLEFPAPKSQRTKDKWCIQCSFEHWLVVCVLLEGWRGWGGVGLGVGWGWGWGGAGAGAGGTSFNPWAVHATLLNHQRLPNPLPSPSASLPPLLQENLLPEFRAPPKVSASPWRGRDLAAHPLPMAALRAAESAATLQRLKARPKESTVHLGGCPHCCRCWLWLW